MMTLMETATDLETKIIKIRNENNDLRKEIRELEWMLSLMEDHPKDYPQHH